ncbi:MAG: RDD family protein [Pyrinomonadaceae bacterium]
MAHAAARATSLARASEKERIVDFAFEDVRAPFSLRCAALIIDYMLLLALPLIWLVGTGLLSETGEMSVGFSVWGIGVILFLANVLILPLAEGRTIGKMLLGLTILKIDGTKLGFAELLKRNLVGYLATALTLGIGFLISAVNTSGRALHDFIGGTVVVRGRKKVIS